MPKAGLLIFPFWSPHFVVWTPYFWLDSTLKLYCWSVYNFQPPTSFKTEYRDRIIWSTLVFFISDSAYL